MKETVVVVGYGWVGQANALALTQMGYPVFFYDPQTPSLKYQDHYKALYEKIPKSESVLSRDSENTWYIVCVGDKVSPEGVQDISFITQALGSLEGARGKVILRSTILPDLLNDLPFDYYLPEFLHEKKAVEECLDPFYFVLGRKSFQVELPSFLKQWQIRAHKVFHGTPEEASFIKYLSNIWNAARIAFVNEFGSLIKEPSTPENLDFINRVINFLFEQKDYVKYGKSFGGHCLPKDSRAFLHWYKEKGEGIDMIAGVCAANDRHINREKKSPLLPEWFAGWQRPLPSGRVALRALYAAVIRKLKKISFLAF